MDAASAPTGTEPAGHHLTGGPRICAEAAR